MPGTFPPFPQFPTRSGSATQECPNWYESGEAAPTMKMTLNIMSG